MPSGVGTVLGRSRGVRNSSGTLGHDWAPVIGLSEHRWEPYTGILTSEPVSAIVQRAGLGPHTRTCLICGVITDDEDACADLDCAPGLHC